jgi:hypothetical protein
MEWYKSPTEAAMTLRHSIAQLQQDHVTFELEGIDRLYLNAYVPQLTSEAGIAAFFRKHLGHRFASTKSAAAITDTFLRAIRDFIHDHDFELVRFRKGQRKDDVLQDRLRHFYAQEGVVFVGVAQEKMRVPRTVRKAFGQGGTIPWIAYSTAMVNAYYFYCLDKDFGPFFIKFGSYFPYPAKVCLNGHEYLKAQLTQRGIAFEPLDNGLRSCADPAAAQRICRGLTPAKIDAFFRKWLHRLPHPFNRQARAAGYRYALSVLQAEFSLTQVWDRGLNGRRFFEEVIRENLDLGRPEQVQLIFGRKLQRSTVARGRCRTRIITEGVTPSLHVYYKNTHLKQYHKEGRALRTETTINNAYDFKVGRLLHNLPRLAAIGFAANRRVLEVETVTHDCHIGLERFEQLQQPLQVQGQHAPALRFGDSRVQALFAGVMLLCFQPEGFRTRQLRPLLAQYLGLEEEDIRPGRMSYDLRRLRLHGLIERIEHTHRYRPTALGLKTAMFYSRSFDHLLRPGLSLIHETRFPHDNRLRRAFSHLEKELARFHQYQLVA